MANKNDYLITSRPLKALFLFFIPIALGNFFQQFYNLVDSSILGHFVSEQALAASAACISLTNVFIFIGNGFGIGAGVIVGKNFGAQNYRQMKIVVLTAYTTSLVLSILLGIIGFTGGRQFLLWLKTPSDVLELAVTYLRIYFLGLPFVLVYNVTASMYNALGKSKFPLFFLIFSSLLNIGLDVLFVTRFHFGITGVAFATLIAQGIACILSVIVFFKTISVYRIGKTPFFSASELSKITKIAFPTILQQAAISIGMMLIQSTINSFGSQVLAGYSVGIRIEALGSAFVIACGVAYSNYTAQNYGAKKLERIPRGYLAANFIVTVICLVFFTFIRIFNTQIIYLMIGKNCSPEAFSTARVVLLFNSTVVCILGYKHNADGVHRGLGRMKALTIRNLLDSRIRVEKKKIMAPFIGMSAIWIGNPIGWSVSMLLSYLSYRHARKELNF